MRKKKLNIATEKDIKEKAYQLYETRLKNNIKGSDKTDWDDAKMYFIVRNYKLKKGL